MTSAGPGPYSELRTRIISGRYAPGALLVPATVGEELGVSRTPIREALIRLELEGLVTKVSRGFVIRERSPEEILDICEARIALESVVARSAALRRTEFDLAMLRRALESARTGVPDERLRAHAEWHIALRVAAHNPTISELMELLDARLHVYDGTASRSTANLDLIEAEHEEIYRAVVDGDGERASELMVVHQTRTRDLRIAEMVESKR
ncbi:MULTISPECIES: GntR family transcriptional regulator [Rhodococcus]|uniref:GntR family transcriptional regulator n=1 Tax=Rhodococcus TaxID=1827 RepID=UPI000622C54E|nr:MULTISPECIES: GntR family transcriptional regulator [Rhodococcus]NCL72653.1 HTH-type transcriptional regulator LutR [Rhodococcus sp. YH1]AKE92035.1 GntR family transcriptional regulator [Rhodococcus aetherivorans]QIX52761.1 GntR family transcriptional regulator [Rhodococcus sp. DMU1]QRI77049.1 GntR family transcriptional regulator [Rhodococcus aetherivorans]QSE60470.1 GntR family transcriptional regulator [Rhodococcus sp. PSBB066]